MLRLISDNINIQFIKLKKLAFSFSLSLSILSILAVIFIGLNFGIDFKGGILIEVRTSDNISIADIRSNISDLDIGEISIQEFGAKSDYLIRVERQKGSDNAQQIAVEALKGALNGAFADGIEYRRLEYVGPTVSKDLISDGVMAIFFAIVFDFAPITFTVINFFAPSPSATICFAKFKQSLCKAFSKSCNLGSKML